MLTEPVLVAAYLVAGTIDAVAMDMTYMKASTLGKRLFSATACLYLWPLWLSIGVARFLGETLVAKIVPSNELHVPEQRPRRSAVSDQETTPACARTSEFAPAGVSTEALPATFAEFLASVPQVPKVESRWLLWPSEGKSVIADEGHECDECEYLGTAEAQAMLLHEDSSPRDTADAYIQEMLAKGWLRYCVRPTGTPPGKAFTLCNCQGRLAVLPCPACAESKVVTL